MAKRKTAPKVEENVDESLESLKAMISEKPNQDLDRMKSEAKDGTDPNGVLKQAIEAAQAPANPVEHTNESTETVEEITIGAMQSSESEGIPAEFKIHNDSGNPTPTYQSGLNPLMNLASYKKQGDFYRIMPGKREIIHTGIKIEIPKGFALQVISDRGAAFNFGLVIDTFVLTPEDSGEIVLSVLNTSTHERLVPNGTVLANLLLCYTPFPLFKTVLSKKVREK